MHWKGLSWRDYSIGTKTRVAVVFPMAALLASCALIGWVWLQQKEANAWVVHTLDVRLALDNFGHQFGASQAGLRNYLQSSNSHARAQAGILLDQARETLSTVQKLTSDNPRQQRRISELSALLNTNAALMERPGGNRASTEVEQQDSISRKIQRIMEAMDAEETALLSGRTSRSGELNQMLSVVIAATIILGVLAGFFGTALLSRNISRRISHLVESSVLIAEG